MKYWGLGPIPSPQSPLNKLKYCLIYFKIYIDDAYFIMLKDMN